MKTWLILKLIRHKPRPPSGEDRFLIVSTTALGDTLWATPAIRALRQAHPTAYIAVLTSPIGKQVLEGNPHIDALFLFKNLILLFFRLRRKKFTKIFIFHASQRLLLPFCALLKAESISGTLGQSKGLDSYITDPISPEKVHEVTRRLKIIGSPASIHPLEIFPPNGAGNQVIGIHPGATDRYKRWPAKSFIALGNLLAETTGSQIVITGSTREKPLIDELVSGIKGAISLPTDLPILSFASLLKDLRLYITNDTGPMHLAFALQVPTVALFTPTDASICGPHFQGPFHVIQKKPTCTPCIKKRCIEPFCLLQISVQEVYDAALNLFYGRSPR